MIRDNRYYPYGDREGYPVIEQKCPKCGSPLYAHEGSDQGGIPHTECTNENCNYISY